MRAPWCYSPTLYMRAPWRNTGRRLRPLPQPELEAPAEWWAVDPIPVRPTVGRSAGCEPGRQRAGAEPRTHVPTYPRTHVPTYPRKQAHATREGAAAPPCAYMHVCHPGCHRCSVCVAFRRLFCGHCPRMPHAARCIICYFRSSSFECQLFNYILF